MDNLFLGVDISKAPEEMRTHLLNAQAAFRRRRRAEVQATAWANELARAQKAHDVAMADYSDVLQRWNPETNELSPKLEEAPNG